MSAEWRNDEDGECDRVDLLEGGDDGNRQEVYLRGCEVIGAVNVGGSR